MSITVNYFFNSDVNDLPELARSINGCLGCSLSPYEGDQRDFFARFLGMEFSLFCAEGYENDREMNFADFSFELDCRIPACDADASPLQLPAMLLVVYNLHRHLGITGMLVYDMQILLARHVEREAEGYGLRLYDSLSGTAFISVRGQLDVMRRLLPIDCQEIA